MGFVLFVVLLGAWIVWNLYSWNAQYVLDTKLTSFFGGGINPPGATEMISALLVFTFCYFLDGSVNRFLESGDENLFSKFVRQMQSAVTFIGKNTLYIFLYHLMFLSYLRTKLVNAGVTNIWVKRFGVYLGILILPAIFGAILHKVVKWIEK